MRLLRYTAVAGLILSVVLPRGARSADPAFCDAYAHASLRQIEVAEHVCVASPNLDSPRWSGGFRRHYDWCLAASYQQAGDEREARREVLYRCGRR